MILSFRKNAGIRREWCCYIDLHFIAMLQWHVTTEYSNAYAAVIFSYYYILQWATATKKGFLKARAAYFFLTQKIQ